MGRLNYLEFLKKTIRETWDEAMWKRVSSHLRVMCVSPYIYARLQSSPMTGVGWVLGGGVAWVLVGVSAGSRGVGSVSRFELQILLPSVGVQAFSGAVLPLSTFMC